MESYFLSSTGIVVILALLYGIAAYQATRADARMPKHLPWAGMQKQYFAKIRVGLRFMKSYRVYLQQAYEDV